MSQYFIPFLMMQVNDKIKDFGWIGIFLMFLFNFLFENNGIYDLFFEYLKNVFSRNYKYTISLHGIKFYDKYGYRTNDKFSTFATPGFIALNDFLMKQLRKGNLKNLNKIDEIMYYNSDEEHMKDLLNFQIHTNSLVYIENNKDWDKIYFTLYEKKMEKNEKSNGMTEMIKVELKLMSNYYNIQELMSKCDTLYHNYEDRKQGKSMEKIFICKYLGVKKQDYKNSFDIIPFKTNCSMDNLYFEEKEKVMSYIKFFQENKEWYKKRGRPYTLGICSYGPPGCGKTSFEKALSIYLKRHLIVIDFDKIKTEQELMDIFYNEYIGPYKIPNEQRLYIFPDIDKTSDILYKEEYKHQCKSNEKQKIIRKQFYKKQNEEDEHSFEKDSNEEYIHQTINLSQILNVIDGIMERTGQIFIMSANHPEKLDDAVLRPGRIDCMIHFREFSLPLMKQFITNFFQKEEEDLNLFLEEHYDEFNYKFTPSKLFEICVLSNNSMETLKKNLFLNKNE